MKLLTLTFFYCFLFACNKTKANKDFRENGHSPKSQTYPETLFSPSRDYRVLAYEELHREVFEWEQWKQHEYVKLHRKKVRIIAIDWANLTEASMNFFSIFDNAETVLIGYSEYGVRLNEKTFQQIKNFKKLRSLKLSVHSLTDDYFNSIKALKTLNYLEVRFPWSPLPDKKRPGPIGAGAAKLSDNALEKISKSESLKEISFAFGGTDVRFSAVGIKKILKIQKLEYFSVNIENILQEDLERIKKLSLKGVSARVHFGSLVWGGREIDRLKGDKSPIKKVEGSE